MVIVVCCLALGGWLLTRHGSQVAQALSQLTAMRLMISFALSLLATFAMLISWTWVVRAHGTPITLHMARGIFPVAQLGKYIPGGIWPLVAQTTLGRHAGLSMVTMGSAAVVNLTLSVGVALLVSGLLSVGPQPSGYAALSLFAAGAGVLLITSTSPPVMSYLRRVVARTRWSVALSRIVPVTGPEIRRAIGWCVAAQFLCGIHVIVLLPHDLDPLTVLYTSAAYSLSAVVGLLVIFAPAGVGVREATLIVLLQPVATPGEALVAAVSSRILLTLSDVVLAAAQARQIRDILLGER